MLAWKLRAVTGIFFLLTAENVLKQEGTGNVRESIKRAKKGVHIFSLRQALLFYKQRDNFSSFF